MATHQKKALTSPEERKVARINEDNRVSIAEFKRRYLETPIMEANLRMVSTGYWYEYDESSKELVRGEKLPADVWKDLNKMMFNKIVPATKEIAVEEADDSVGVLKRLIARADDKEKAEDYKRNSPIVLDGEVTQVAGDVDL